MLVPVRLRFGVIALSCAAGCGDDSGGDGGDSLGATTADTAEATDGGTGTTGAMGTTAGTGAVSGTGTAGSASGDPTGTSDSGVDSTTGGGSTSANGEPEMWPKDGCFLQSQGFNTCDDGCALLQKTCVPAGCPDAQGRVMEQYPDEATCDAHEAFAWGQNCDDVFTWPVPLARCCCQ